MSGKQRQWTSSSGLDSNILYHGAGRIMIVTLSKTTKPNLKSLDIHSKNITNSVVQARILEPKKDGLKRPLYLLLQVILHMRSKSGSKLKKSAIAKIKAFDIHKGSVDISSLLKRFILIKYDNEKKFSLQPKPKERASSYDDSETESDNSLSEYESKTPDDDEYFSSGRRDNKPIKITLSSPKASIGRRDSAWIEESERLEESRRYPINKASASNALRPSKVLKRKKKNSKSGEKIVDPALIFAKTAVITNEKELNSTRQKLKHEKLIGEVREAKMRKTFSKLRKKVNKIKSTNREYKKNITKAIKTQELIIKEEGEGKSEKVRQVRELARIKAAAFPFKCSLANMSSTVLSGPQPIREIALLKSPTKKAFNCHYDQRGHLKRGRDKLELQRRKAYRGFLDIFERIRSFATTNDSFYLNFEDAFDKMNKRGGSFLRKKYFIRCFEDIGLGDEDLDMLWAHFLPGATNRIDAITVEDLKVGFYNQRDLLNRIRIMKEQQDLRMNILKKAKVILSSDEENIDKIYSPCKVTVNVIQLGNAQKLFNKENIFCIVAVARVKNDNELLILDERRSSDVKDASKGNRETSLDIIDLQGNEKLLVEIRGRNKRAESDAHSNFYGELFYELADFEASTKEPKWFFLQHSPECLQVLLQVRIDHLSDSCSENSSIPKANINTRNYIDSETESEYRSGDHSNSDENEHNLYSYSFSRHVDSSSDDEYDRFSTVSTVSTVDDMKSTYSHQKARGEARDLIKTLLKTKRPDSHQTTHRYLHRKGNSDEDSHDDSSYNISSDDEYSLSTIEHEMDSSSGDETTYSHRKARGEAGNLIKTLLKNSPNPRQATHNYRQTRQHALVELNDILQNKFLDEEVETTSSNPDNESCFTHCDTIGEAEQVLQELLHDRQLYQQEEHHHIKSQANEQISRLLQTHGISK